jgi:hypothetical protein
MNKPPEPAKERKKRRKCYVCGKYGDPSKMKHGGYSRLMYSEAHFAHADCLTPQSETKGCDK